MYELKPFLDAHSGRSLYEVEARAFFPSQKDDGSWFLRSRQVEFKDGIGQILQDNKDAIALRYRIVNPVTGKSVQFPNTLHIITPDHTICPASLVDEADKQTFFLMTDDKRDWYIPEGSYMLKMGGSPYRVYLRHFEGFICADTGMPIGHVVEATSGQFEIKEIDLPPELCAVQPTKLNVVTACTNNSMGLAPRRLSELRQKAKSCLSLLIGGGAV